MSDPPDGQALPGSGLMETVGGATPEADGAQLRLSVAAVARRLGVAPATLRTWDRRYGLGPAEHAPGAHRRYGAADIARLETMQQALLSGVGPAEAARYALASQPRVDIVPDIGFHAVPDVVPDVVPVVGRDDSTVTAPIRPVRLGGRPLRMPGAGPRARGLARGAVSLDAAAIRDVLDDALVELGVAATWDHVVRPVLGAIADCWESTGMGVGIEHLLSGGALDALLDATRRAPVPQNRRSVLLACVPDELHSLPLHALSATLAHRAIRCQVLGAALPLEALCDAVRRTAPSVVFLWAQMRQYAVPGLLAALPRIRQRFRVFVGGPGWERPGLPQSVELLESLTSAADRIAGAVGARTHSTSATT